MNAKRNTIVVLATALAFAALFQLNSLLFSAFEFAKGVSWIFLPSGLRLAFILVFGEWGALGIVLGSFAIGYEQHYSGDGINAVLAGVISGVSPLLANKFCADFLHLKTNLDGLTASSLLNIAAVFSIMSPVLHQIWYVAHGQTTDFLSSTAVMALGDFTGTVIVLYIAKFLITALQNISGLKSRT